MTDFSYLPDTRSLALAGAIAFSLLLLSYWFAKGRASWLQLLRDPPRLFRVCRHAVSVYQAFATRALKRV